MTILPITIQDVVNPDSSVTRTVTNVTVINYTAEQYQDLQTQLQEQITQLQAKLTPINANVAQIQNIAPQIQNNNVTP